LLASRYAVIVQQLTAIPRPPLIIEGACERAVVHDNYFARQDDQIGDCQTSSRQLLSVNVDLVTYVYALERLRGQMRWKVNPMFPVEKEFFGNALGILEKFGHCATRFNFLLCRRR
jgi:hypothetical protein